MSSAQPPSAPSAEVDVGILNADRQQVGAAAGDPAINHGAAANDNTQQDGSADDSVDTYDGPDDYPTDRWDVFTALNSASYRGSCCAADKADGTTTTPALPSTPGLRINNIGKIPLPVVSDSHAAKAIKSNAWKIEDKSYHKVYQIEPHTMKIRNPAWEASLKNLVKTAAYKLGVDPTRLTAELDMLLYMDKGSRVDRCRNADEGGNIFGTLLVQLPSIFTGGKMHLFSGNEEDEEDDEEDGDTMSTFNLGASREAEFSCHFMCHYADVEYEIEKIKSGSRMLLRYSLHFRGQTKPTARLLNSSMSPLKWSLNMLPRMDRIILVPLATSYTPISLMQHGINALSDHHRANAEAIKVAGKGWKLLIVNAKMSHTQLSSGYHGHVTYSNSTSSIEQIFDEHGDDVSLPQKWLKKVVDFDTLSEDDEDEGMMLSHDDGYSDIWGRFKSHTSSRRGYHYDEEEEATKKLYEATFLLAYDTSSEEIELKCLSGCEGVAEVSDKVVATRDYGLLKRLLSTVETKEKSKLTVHSCGMLLQMMTRSTGKAVLSSSRITLVNRILLGLSTSFEPSEELYETVLAAVKTFGHDELSGSISKLLGDETRMHGHELSVFLRRADFILNLNKCLESESNHLEKSISDLTSHGKTRISDSTVINVTIISMISHHGWEAMGNVVKASLDFMHKVSSKMLPDLMNRARLLWKFRRRYNQGYNFIQACLVDFVVPFVAGLKVNSTPTVIGYMNGQHKRLFMKLIRFVIEYGKKDELHGFGLFAIKTETLLSALLKAIAESNVGMASQVMLRDILNKCLVQRSVTMRSGWPNHTKEDGISVHPSSHVRKFLEAYPDMVKKTDGDGRLTLHHAVDSTSAPFEAVMDVFEANPKSVSVRDPVSGLYPFMLAASNDNIAASFSLLLADPSLVLGGTQVDTIDSNKKRKRSPSMG